VSSCGKAAVRGCWGHGRGCVSFETKARGSSVLLGADLRFLTFRRAECQRKVQARHRQATACLAFPYAERRSKEKRPNGRTSDRSRRERITPVSESRATPLATKQSPGAERHAVSLPARSDSTGADPARFRYGRAAVVWDGASPTLAPPGLCGSRAISSRYDCPSSDAGAEARCAPAIASRREELPTRAICSLLLRAKRRSEREVCRTGQECPVRRGGELSRRAGQTPPLRAKRHPAPNPA